MKLVLLLIKMNNQIKKYQKHTESSLKPLAEIQHCQTDSNQDADANARFQKRFSPNTGLIKRQKWYVFH